MIRAAVLAALIASPALGACPVPDKARLDAARDPLFQALAETETQSEAAVLVDTIWLSWVQAPDAQAQAMLDEGMSRLRVSDYDAAKAVLTDLVAYCPDYAEGWNQRAFARFLSNDLDGALADLDRAIALEPRHFAALAGKGVTLLRQGRTMLGHQAIRDALELNPWLSERRFLPPSEKT